MWQDIRFAARSLAKTPLFSLAVIALLGLGVTSNTATFALVDALLLRPLPVRDPGGLVRPVTIRPPLGPRGEFDFEHYEAWKKHAAAFQDVFAWAEEDMFVATSEAVERIRVHFVTENFFESLGVTPAAGRFLTNGDRELSAGIAPAILSYGYWRRRFSGDTGVIGRTISLSGHKVLIIGVTRREFNGMTVESGPDLRVPMGWVRSMVTNLDEGRVYCEVAARLRSGATLEAARQEAEAVWLQTARQLGAKGESPPRFDLEPATRGVSRMRGQFSSVLQLVLCGTALLLVMICANVAGLLMARSTGRESDLAVRVALGASKIHLFRHVFCEALLLMSGAAGLAWILSVAAMPVVEAALPPVRDLTAVRLTLSLDLSPNWRVFGFAMALSALAILVFGLAPALQATRHDLHRRLKEARGGARWNGRQFLVTVQIALCTVMMAAAGLTVLTLERLQRLNPGFDGSRIVTFSVDPSMARYQPAQTVALQRRLLDGVRELADVEAVAVASRGLMRGTGIKMTIARFGERVRPEDYLNTSLNSVSPEYFDTMRIRLLEGRIFTGQEEKTRLPAPVLVNEAFAQRFANGRTMLGGKFGNSQAGQGAAKPIFEVIGVVSDTKYRSLREPFQPILYQLASPESPFILHVRTRSNPESAIVPVRALLNRLEPRLSFIEVTTLTSEVEASLWGERATASLAGVFSVVAALIAGTGLYALIAFAVAQRQREIGIRVALGAAPGDIALLMLTRAAAAAALGVSAGVACALALAPAMSGLMYETGPRDLRALTASVAFTLFVTAVAALIPAFRASRLQAARLLSDAANR